MKKKIVVGEGEIEEEVEVEREREKQIIILQPKKLAFFPLSLRLSFVLLWVFSPDGNGTLRNPPVVDSFRRERETAASDAGRVFSFSFSFLQKKKREKKKNLRGEGEG